MPKRRAEIEPSEPRSKRAVEEKQAADDDDANEEEEENWKETLFHWRGELSLETKGKRGACCLVWRGTWVGYWDDDLPTAEDFRASPNKFELSLALPADRQPSRPLQIHELSDIEGKWTGSYLLEGRKTRDTKHLFRIDGVACDDEDEDGGEVPYVAAAVGDTPFGRFVSLGLVSAAVTGASSSGLRLDLVRRYVDDDDPRAGWTTPGKPLGALTGSAEHREPWKCLPVKLA